MRTDDDARENNVDLRSKSLESSQAACTDRVQKTYLILAALTPVCTFYVHYKNVHILTSTHPDTWKGEGDKHISRITHTSVEGGKGTLHTCRTVAMRHQRVRVAHKPRVDCRNGRKAHGKGSYLPLVVCCRFNSSMTLKFVPNSRLRRVPVYS